jgi:endoglucanase
MALLPTSDVVAELGRGINLAGVFDRRDDRPGWPVRAEHVAAIASAGFTALRVPVRWWGRADELLASVEALVEIAWSHGLAVVLTMHHADAVCQDPVGSAATLTAVWRRIAGHFAGARGALAFELLNEPRPPMTPSDWNALLPRVLAGVREHDSKRVVIAGGAEAATLAGLRQLQLPRDEHLIATLHYYEPFRFTHQGAAWEAGAHDWLGTSWGTLAEHAAVTTDLETAAAWARREGVRLYVGEFGTIDTADHDSRVRWTHWVRRELDRLDLPWAYWDFATDFGAYDRHRHGWRPELLEALVR